MNEAATTALVKSPTGIKSVGYFRDGHGRLCDRCGTLIKNVACVSFKDGTNMSYGLDCIDKVLNHDHSLQSLWSKNLKMLKRLQSDLEILSRDPKDMPVGKPSRSDRPSTARFIASDDKGSWMCHEHYYFHPLHLPQQLDGKPIFDMRNLGLSAWEPYTADNWVKKCNWEIEQAKKKLSPQIERISTFLGRILQKGLVTAPKTESATSA